MKKILIGLLLVLCTGCFATGGPGTVEQLAQNKQAVSIGMSMQEVRTLLGPPQGVSQNLAGSITIEMWSYTLNGLSENNLSKEQQVRMGFLSAGENWNLNAVNMIITFTNGYVSGITK